MVKNKMLGTMVVILLVITIAGMVVLYMLLQDDKGKGSPEQTIDKIIEYSVDIPELTTNLNNGDFLRVQYKIETNSKDAKEELTKRDFQVKDIIIKELSQMNPEQFRKAGGIANLEGTITKKLNDLMQHGSVVKVYTTSFLLQ